MHVEELVELLHQHCRPGDHVYVETMEGASSYDEPELCWTAGINPQPNGTVVICTGDAQYEASSTEQLRVWEAEQREIAMGKAAEQAAQAREDYLRDKFEKHGMNYDDMKEILP